MSQSKRYGWHDSANVCKTASSCVAQSCSASKRSSHPISKPSNERLALARRRSNRAQPAAASGRRDAFALTVASQLTTGDIVRNGKRCSPLQCREPSATHRPVTRAAAVPSRSSSARVSGVSESVRLLSFDALVRAINRSHDVFKTKAMRRNRPNFSCTKTP